MTLTIRPDQQLPPGADESGDTTLTFTVKRSPGGLMAVLKARCIARYRLHDVPGRPEELARAIQPISAIPQSTEPIGYASVAERTISFGYIHGSVRIRKHGGERNREWVDVRDITFKDGWLDEVYAYLDSFMGYKPPVSARAVIPVPGFGDIIIDGPPPRPIRDNPQA